jgi:1-acylglycerone phosphate reductase
MENIITKKSVLITGCSTGGIGHALALEFHQRGLHVFATARNLSKMSSLASLPHMTLLSLDVTSTSSITAAVKAVHDHTNGKLDYLVNNSGAQYVMPILDADIEKAKQMYDVNVWGIVAVTQAFAQMLVKARGCVVNISSIAGCLYPPWMGAYLPDCPPQSSSLSYKLTLHLPRPLRRFQIR